MKVYVMLQDDSDIIDTRNIFIVGNRNHANILVDKGYFISYEVVDVATAYDIEHMFLQDLGRG